MDRRKLFFLRRNIIGTRAGTILSIVGVSFCQENVRQMKEDDVVTLKHDMSNEYDKHAITVLDSKGNRLGFLPKLSQGDFLTLPKVGL